eukprot:2616618-Pleurochrysis_carterae.AAC.1
MLLLPVFSIALAEPNNPALHAIAPTATVPIRCPSVRFAAFPNGVCAPPSPSLLRSARRVGTAAHAPARRAALPAFPRFRKQRGPYAIITRI